MGLVRFDRSVCMFVSSANTSMHMDALSFAASQAENLERDGQSATDDQLVAWYLTLFPRRGFPRARRSNAHASLGLLSGSSSAPEGVLRLIWTVCDPSRSLRDTLSP